MALPKIDFDQNDHDHFDHDTGAVQPHRNLDSGENVSHGATLLQRHTLAGSLFDVLVCHIVGLL